MNGAWLKDERLVDLLVKQTTEGLSPVEQAEIERLLASHPDADRDSIARTAAALTLAADFKEEPMPRSLRERLQADAARWLATRDSGVVDLAARREARVKPQGSGPSLLPWFAAAACLVLAVLSWWPRLRETPPQQAVVVEPPITVPVPAPTPPTPAQEREQLLASGNAVRSEWSGTEDPASRGVSGDVVWDNTAKKGYLRFTGLSANDPQRSQYQLWIFDKQQDERYPIDGGVFDIPAGATEVVVPIRPKIGVSEPMMFAVTVEKPGGVVVSGREHLVALAKVAAG
jgi:hypothetical protein